MSDIPDSSDRALSQLRTPMRQDATGPRPAIPARLSPPPPSRRSHLQPNSDSRGPRHIDDKASSRASYDSKPVYQLPIHSGPPPSRSNYSPSTLGSPPVSPYAATSTDTRRYTKGDSQSLPPHPTLYQNPPNGRAASYALPSDYRNGDSCYGGPCFNDGRGRETRSAGPPTYQSQHHTYPTVQYSYPPPPPSTNGNYAVHHQYSNGHHHGSVQFESDDSSGQAPRRRRGNLPRDTTDLLKQWFADHLGHPYPTEDEKQMLCRQTGLQMTQVGIICTCSNRSFRSD